MSRQQFIEELQDLLKRYCYDNSEYENVYEYLTVKLPNKGGFESEVRVIIDTYLCGKKGKI